MPIANRVAGYIHDYDTLITLSDTSCNLLLVSDRSLHILNGLSSLDVTFLTRYAVQFNADGTYLDVQEGTSEAEAVEGFVDALRGDLMPCDIDSLITAINGIAAAITDKMCCPEPVDCPQTVGEADTEPTGEASIDPPRPIGDFIFEGPADDPYKCGVANVIVSTLLDTFTELAGYPVLSWAGYALALSVGIVTAILAALATPIAALLIGTAGALITFLIKVIFSSWDIDNVVAVLTTDYENLVCALYMAGDTVEAKENFKVESETAGLTPVEAEIVGLLLTNGVLAQLFWQTDQMTSYLATYTPPYDCQCGPGTCDLSFLLVDSTPMGSGSLVADGLPRDITAAYNSYVGYWYIQIQVGPPTTSSGWNTCANVDPSCYGVSDYYQFLINSVTGSGISSAGSICDAGTPSIQFIASGYPAGVVNCSYIEIISTVGSFVANITISPRA